MAANAGIPLLHPPSALRKISLLRRGYRIPYHLTTPLFREDAHFYVLPASLHPAFSRCVRCAFHALTMTRATVYSVTRPAFSPLSRWTVAPLLRHACRAKPPGRGIDGRGRHSGGTGGSRRDGARQAGSVTVSGWWATGGTPRPSRALWPARRRVSSFPAAHCLYRSASCFSPPCLPSRGGALPPLTCSLPHHGRVFLGLFCGLVGGLCVCRACART